MAIPTVLQGQLGKWKIRASCLLLLNSLSSWTQQMQGQRRALPSPRDRRDRGQTGLKETLTWDQAVRSAAAICWSLVRPSRESTGIRGEERAIGGEGSLGWSAPPVVCCCSPAVSYTTPNPIQEETAKGGLRKSGEILGSLLG